MSLPGVRIRVLGQQPEPDSGLSPYALEIGLHSRQPLLLQVVDAPGAVCLLGPHSGILQQPQVPRHRRAADGQRCRNLMHRLVAAAQQAQDLTPVRVPQRFERIPAGPGGRHCDQCPASTRRLSPRANLSNDGPRSGIDRQINPSNGPVYSSRTWNAVPPVPSGDTLKVRTPRNRPRGIPPLNRSRAGGSKSVTLTGKARPGAAWDRIVIFSPGAIRPSTPSTPESHDGQAAPSASTAHTASGLDAIVELAS